MPSEEDKHAVKVKMLRTEVVMHVIRTCIKCEFQPGGRMSREILIVKSFLKLGFKTKIVYCVLARYWQCFQIEKKEKNTEYLFPSKWFHFNHGEAYGPQPDIEDG